MNRAWNKYCYGTFWIVIFLIPSCFLHLLFGIILWGRVFPSLLIYSLIYINTESWNLVLFYSYNPLLTLCIRLSKLSQIWPVGFLSSWVLCPFYWASIIFQGFPYFIPQEYLWGLLCTFSVSEFLEYIVPSLISKILNSHGPLPAGLSCYLFFLIPPTLYPLKFYKHSNLSSYIASFGKTQALIFLYTKPSTK